MKTKKQWTWKFQSFDSIMENMIKIKEKTTFDSELQVHLHCIYVMPDWIIYIILFSINKNKFKSEIQIMSLKFRSLRGFKASNSFVLQLKHWMYVFFFQKFREIYGK